MNNSSEFDDLIERYKKIDFSKNSKYKEKNLEKLLCRFKTIEESRAARFMNKKLVRRMPVLIATLTMLLSFALIAYGQETVQFIKEIIIALQRSFERTYYPNPSKAGTRFLE
jgi:hypothetical protein